MGEIITTAIERAMTLPGVQVDRNNFLRNNLRRYCTDIQLTRALTLGPTHANIPIETLDKIAKSVINNNSLKTSMISALTGAPGGAAILATLPIDVVQFYGHTLRAAQELAYIYGWNDLSNTDASTQTQLLIFLGSMTGVECANNALTKLFAKETSKILAEKAAADAFAKKLYYPLLRIIAKEYAEKKATVSASRLALAKVLPVAGAATSGALTFAMFKPMAHRLQKKLSELARMSPDELSRYEASVVIDINEYDELDQRGGLHEFGEIVDTDRHNAISE